MVVVCIGCLVVADVRGLVICVLILGICSLRLSIGNGTVELSAFCWSVFYSVHFNVLQSIYKSYIIAKSN